jgi:hypothetical protein
MPELPEVETARRLIADEALLHLVVLARAGGHAPAPFGIKIFWADGGAERAR